MTSAPQISGAVDFSWPIDRTFINGKTALVTGGASGMGAAVSKTLAAAGATVTIVDLNTEAGEQCASELVKEGFKVDFAKADVSNWQEMVNAFKQCIQSSPNRTIDIVIACAGLNGISLFQDSPFVSEDSNGDPAPPSLSVINANLIGAFYTACLAIYYFRQTAKSPEEFQKANKQLIFFASNIAYFPMQLFSSYTASKSGVRGLWQSLRGSPDLTGIRTNLVAPHIVRTPMTKDYSQLLEDNGIRLAEIGEIVDVVVRLVCDESIRGRAVAVYPGAAYDTHDAPHEYDEWKGYAETHATEGGGDKLWSFMGDMLRTGVRPGGEK